MVQGASIIDDWIAEGEARGIARGEARGIARGEARGEAMQARRMLLTFLRARFGELPETLVQRIAVADVSWCEALLLAAARAESLSELSW